MHSPFSLASVHSLTVCMILAFHLLAHQQSMFPVISKGHLYLTVSHLDVPAFQLQQLLPQFP